MLLVLYRRSMLYELQVVLLETRYLSRALDPIKVSFATMSYRVKTRMDNSVTLFVFTRDFFTELGALLTILMCSLLGIPVTSTNCATCATAAIGLQWKPQGCQLEDGACLLESLL